jgi:hypothetical protein
MPESRATAAVPSALPSSTTSVSTGRPQASRGIASSTAPMASSSLNAGMTTTTAAKRSPGCAAANAWAARSDVLAGVLSLVRLSESIVVSRGIVTS